MKEEWEYQREKRRDACINFAIIDVIYLIQNCRSSLRALPLSLALWMKTCSGEVLTMVALTVTPGALNVTTIFSSPPLTGDSTEFNQCRAIVFHSCFCTSWGFGYVGSAV